MVSSLPTLTPSPSEIRDMYLRVIRNGLFDLGIDADVSQGSDYYATAEALSGMMSVLYNQLIASADALMPDTATSDDLDRWLGIVGLTRRPAGGSFGAIIYVGDFAAFVPAGSELTSQSGKRFTISQGGTFATSDVIRITSSDVGADTNLDISEVLTWSSAPLGASSTVNLSIACTGGVDVEIDDVARTRLLDRLAHAPSAANWSWIADMAENISPSVQKAFVYPVANGPSTVHNALAGIPALVSKSRQIDSVEMNSAIIPSILGRMPEYVETITTSVTDVPCDVALSMTIPVAVGASSKFGPGTGTGWKDASPWPAVDRTSHFFCPVGTIDPAQVGAGSVSTFPIDSPTSASPTPGITRIMWVDSTQDQWVVREATVKSFTGTGPFTVTIDVPFVGLSAGDFIFPSCVNAQVYLDAVVAAFALMGPGEKVDTVSVPIASRRPKVVESWTANLDSFLLRKVVQSNQEIATVEYLARTSVLSPLPSVDTSNTVLVPNRPTNINDPPNILIPRRIGFYPPATQ